MSYGNSLSDIALQTVLACVYIYMSIYNTMHIYIYIYSHWYRNVYVRVLFFSLFLSFALVSWIDRQKTFLWDCLAPGRWRCRAIGINCLKWLLTVPTWKHSISLWFQRNLEFMIKLQKWALICWKPIDFWVTWTGSWHETQAEDGWHRSWCQWCSSSYVVTWYWIRIIFW